MRFCWVIMGLREGWTRREGLQMGKFTRGGGYKRGIHNTGEGRWTRTGRLDANQICDSCFLTSPPAILAFG